MLQSFYMPSTHLPLTVTSYAISIIIKAKKLTFVQYC